MALASLVSFQKQKQNQEQKRFSEGRGSNIASSLVDTRSGQVKSEAEKDKKNGRIFLIFENLTLNTAFSCRYLRTSCALSDVLGMSARVASAAVFCADYSAIQRNFAILGFEPITIL